MKKRRFFTRILVLSILAIWAHQLPAAPIDELLSAARREGIIEFYATSNLTPQGARELGEAFNKKYGLNISVKYSAGGNMAADMTKIVSQAAMGIPPEWDLTVATDSAHTPLYLRKLHERFDYRKLGVDPEIIHYDNGSVSIANVIALPAYNKHTLPANDVPKSWEDVLNPKLKGGRVGVSVATHHFARLAAGPWGEEKATRYVRALASLKPTLGPLGEIYNRLQIGEILIAATLTDTYINTAKKTGAPIVHAEQVEPVVSPAWYAGVPKGALHPNVAHLFVAFLTSAEAQQIWEKYTGQTSAFVPGTSTNKYARGKKMVYLSQDQAEIVDRLTKEYAKMLGFTRH